MRTRAVSKFSAGANLSFTERISKLHLKRQELIRPVQENPKEYVLLSIRDLAQRLKTDPATVLRIVRGLGFDSYREFKAYLHELSIASATSLEGMQSAIPNDSSLASHGRRTLEQDIQHAGHVAAGLYHRADI